jgi:hypothetical protein
MKQRLLALAHFKDGKSHPQITLRFKVSCTSVIKLVVGMCFQTDTT